MNYLLLVTGILIYAGIICDLAYTTFSSNGAGYLTNALTKTLWRSSLRLSGYDGSKKFLEYTGIYTIGVVVVAWFFGIWLGSALIIMADPASVVDANTSQVADTIGKVYYTGYTLTTLGNGDFKANGNGWRLFTVVLSFSGFMLLTTAVSYMLPVLSADVAKKCISKKILLLGRNPQEILLNNYYRGSFKQLESYFSDLTEMIITHSQQLLAYPILYSFHASHLAKSSSVSIAVLDEALTILLLHIPEENRPTNQAIAPLRKAIATFLNILDNNFTKDAQADASVPELDMLKRADVTLINCAGEKEQLYKKLSRRRHLIGVMLSNEGWEFSDIYKLTIDPEQEI
jgi:hypothetical protein